jgi:hypothetical protein
MGHCKDCQWWHRFTLADDRWDPVERWDGWGRCQAADSDMGGPLTEDTLAFVDDAGCNGPLLMTKPDFGCVMFEAKE